MFSTRCYSSMKTSCIIPTHNRRQYVQRAIESAMGQDHPVDEIIVVDDGSCDDTADVVAKRFPQVRLVRTPGVGPGPARNKGVEESTGEILLFLDSDDLWKSYHVESLANLIEDGNEVAYGITRTLDRIHHREFLIPDPQKIIQGFCFSSLTRWCHMVPSSLAVTRRAFERVGGFPGGTLGEDWLFLLNLAALYPFACCDRVITLRFLHTGSLCCRNQWTRMDILSLLGRIEKLVCGQSRCADEDLKRLKDMKVLALERADDWMSIQDWYTDASRKGLV